MRVIADTHTHTLASDHAYSTVTENCRGAKENGLRFMAMTDHAPKLNDAPYPWFFTNIFSVPDIIDGIVVLKGAEVNILTPEGEFDIDDKCLGSLDWVIASFHTPTFITDDMERQTQAWLNVAKNPLVDVIGHSGDGRFPFDYERVIKEFAYYDKIVEVNSHSFKVRPKSEINCPEILKICKKYGVRVVANSDAHFWTQVGKVDLSLELLREVDYPKELIINIDYDRFLKVAREKSGRELI